MVENTPRVLAGRYEVGELVGRGGMAEVHIGHDTRLGRTVAIKVLRSDLARDPSFLVRFRREAQSAAALNHPAVVAVYDTGEDIHQDASGQDVHVPFIVMEYVEGHTVRDILTDGAAVPIEEAVEITVGVLSALEYSHHAGIVHRDIKPANVMITPTGAVKVMDFGIARAMADSAATMTQTHAVIGTAQYLSPEQARGEQVDTRSDLYSTGCMLFELLTGRPPFQGDSPVAVAYQHVGQEPQRPSEVATDVPDVLDRITLKALTKDREQRYSTAAEFRRDLESAMRGGQVTAPMVGAAMMGATQVAGQPAYGATQVMSPTQANWGPTTATQSPVTPGGGYPGQPTRGEEPEKKSKALMWWLLGIALAAVAAIAIAVAIENAANQEPTTVSVPTIAEGLSVDEARAQVEAAGLTFERAIDKESDLEEGQTTGRTEPSAGSEVEPDSSVVVFVAGAPGQVTIPDVSGLSESDARSRLEEDNLTVGGTESENSRSVSEGMVTKSEPSAGQTVQEGAEVTLYLSTGQTTLPNVVGQTREAAEPQLTNIGLGTINWDEEESDEVPAGTVARTDPEAGDVPQGTTVTVYIATAPEPKETTVPTDLVGKTLEEAQVSCTGAQVTCVKGSEEPSTAVQPGQVIRSEPEPGTTVEQGATISLVIASDPEGDGGDEGEGGGEGGEEPIFP
ncbi:Stk1 family PASTA domain-containing Ser/Thr kinase [Promicromonospora aerolata]|uniref:non-specific serine/threonine protein kinase n=1 Tax=Promicromonospora aerolata TaxID=195749 RepID=A0ABW4VBN1_9MICO